MGNSRNTPGLRNVVLCAIVNVKVEGIQADSDDEAIEKAQAMLNLHEVFRRTPVPAGVTYIEWAEGYSNYLVDHARDIDYRNSCWYKDGHGKFIIDGKGPG